MAALLGPRKAVRPERAEGHRRNRFRADARCECWTRLTAFSGLRLWCDRRTAAGVTRSPSARRTKAAGADLQQGIGRVHRSKILWVGNHERNLSKHTPGASSKDIRLHATSSMRPVSGVRTLLFDVKADMVQECSMTWRYRGLDA